MRLDFFQSAGIVLGIFVLLYILGATLLKSSVSLDSLEYANGRVEHFERFKVKSKWSISYDIRLTNDSSRFKIMPEYCNCVDSHGMELKSLIGKQVTLGVDTDNGFRSNLIRSVVSLKLEHVEYIDLSCVNEKIKSDKWKIPTLIIGFLMLLRLLILGSRRLKR